jgi:hypothetical protein
VLFSSSISMSGSSLMTLRLLLSSTISISESSIIIGSSALMRFGGLSLLSFPFFIRRFLEAGAFPFRGEWSERYESSSCSSSASPSLQWKFWITYRVLLWTNLSRSSSQVPKQGILQRVGSGRPSSSRGDSRSRSSCY